MTGFYEADIAISSSGDNTIVAAAAGRSIQVYGIWLVANAANTLKFGDGTSGPAYFNATAFPLTAQGSSFTLGLQTAAPWFTTTVGNGFSINLGTAAAVIGRIYYKLS